MALQDWAPILFGGLAVGVGAFVQGTVGFGVAMVAAPVVTLLNPGWMPVSLLVVSFAVPTLSLVVEHDDIDRTAGWLLAGRVVGTVPGVWAVAHLSAAGLSVGIGVLVLLALALTVRTFVVAKTPVNLSIAGFFSGLGGTAASISAPPMAIVYQHEPGPRFRSTMALVMSIGSLVSLAALLLGGELHGRDLLVGLSFLPFVVVGFCLSLPLRKRLSGASFRRAVLAVAAVCALAVLVRGLVML